MFAVNGKRSYPRSLLNHQGTAPICMGQAVTAVTKSCAPENISTSAKVNVPLAIEPMSVPVLVPEME